MARVWQRPEKFAFVLASGLVFFVACGCSKPMPTLSTQELQAWEEFLDKQLSSGMVQPTSEDASAVSAIGDKIIPRIEENLGKAYRGPGGKGDYWLVIVLARIGSPRAVKTILEVLKHDYQGKIGHDREIAARALVWLGAKEAAPVLKEAIADHEKRIAEKAAGGASESQMAAYNEEVKNLKECLKQLEEGKGKRDTRNFPFDFNAVTLHR